MEELGDKLDKIPISGKTGAKIGATAGCALASNPITAPIAAGVTLGGVAVYGIYKVCKFVIEKEDRA